MSHDDAMDYDDLIGLFELVWGDGYMSPGGPEEVALLLDAVNLTNAEVLDVGCGTGGVDVELVRGHGAASVLGIDVNPRLIDRALTRAEHEGLGRQLDFRTVDPGPLPFDDASFDVVFSRDAILHIPDKATFLDDVFRVLRAGGIFVGSDWLRRDDEPPTPEMLHWIETEGLGFVPASPQDYQKAFAASGFGSEKLTDRNAWYRELAQKEHARMAAGGDLNELIHELLGDDNALREIEAWRAMTVVLDSGELRPTHLRATKPDV
ncbi:MAG TPA: methyltransferase domain-containing protein [Acidobacteriota bacterium]|nr:methyltransferase domain-containing protein [Acidobacteriota bacterium]